MDTTKVYEGLTPEEKEKAKEEEKRIAKKKAELKELLDMGVIDGAQYNRSVIDLVVPDEPKPKLPKNVKRNCILILVGLALLFIIPEAIFLNWRYYLKNTLTASGVPDYSEKMTSSIDEDPIQIDLDGSSERGEYKGRPIDITYKAYYDITGVVTSVRDYWGFGAYDTLAPRDICMVWGKLAERYPSSDMEFHHGERACYSRVPDDYIDLKRGGSLGDDHYGSSLVSNNHLIPSTAEVRHEFFSFGAGDIIRIVGYLVKVRYDGILLDSSMTRDDVIFDRNSTTCEIIYVTKAEKLGRKE